MTIAQIIASMLFVASYDIPRPEFWRHARARRELMRSLRSDEACWRQRRSVTP